ncbi:amino acid ABC transporter ATP-binding protein [Hydrogenophaga electricum]|uniref:ATP-binding protein n=1 Tax=Hydrogenophaga electricum TaxID=1230953 RepID=A0ABQ6C2R7_9BURK|nr:amino acid ABC transporter ATP-binding protein [Hydrogenophaga electricum]GLS14597.1 ATP-binding protein [Hydrogenophaga electricum]
MDNLSTTNSPKGHVLRLHKVVKRYGSFQVLNEVSLDIDEGEVVAVIGPSGSGKSTLVRCIHQLETIEGGSIYLNGELLGYRQDGAHLRALGPRELARQRQQLGMVFQQFGLFPHMTVEENVMEGPVQVLGDSTADARTRARHLLGRVGLAEKVTAYPQMLSGGQQQRVAIARALAMRPKVMLFDEPTSALDPELVGEVLSVVSDLAKAGKTMVIVTHEIAFAREVATRVVFMEGGRILEQGDARETLSNPRTDRLRSFLSRVM